MQCTTEKRVPYFSLLYTACSIPLPFSLSLFLSFVQESFLLVSVDWRGEEGRGSEGWGWDDGLLVQAPSQPRENAFAHMNERYKIIKIFILPEIGCEGAVESYRPRFSTGFASNDT